MATPAKPFTVLQSEKKSHRTKAELAYRKQEEQALLSGVNIKELPEVRNNERAHKEFLRLKKILQNIEKNDAIYERSINRYCLLTAEEAELQEQIEVWKENIQDLDDNKGEFNELKTYYALKLEMNKAMIAIEKQLQAKRSMLFALEKENAMTIASALRSIPKKQPQSRNKLWDALGGD